MGLIINPIAGMGGSVGLKGTDGDTYLDAIDMGAKPVTPERLRLLLSHLTTKEEIYFLAAPDKMGGDILKEYDFEFEIIGKIDNKTSAEDTKRFAKQMMQNGVKLLIFCGGDGTARDIYDAIQLKIPVVAVPAGVKMFSSVFTLNPIAAAEMVDDFINGTDTEEKEVLDIDEDAFRNGKLKSRLYGFLRVPKVEKLLQAGKQGSKLGKSVEENKKEISRFLIGNMKDDILYLLGPGTTVKSISNELNIPKALLGIDAIYNKELKGKDINEKAILELLDKYKEARIIVSPIGGQGFIFGRGNKQFTPEVLKRVGIDNIHVISTEDKIKGLDFLRVDTGDRALDEDLKGYKKVLVGHDEYILMEIEV
ncbi:MAG: ATP-NAD kinase [Promethearchaeota archaeon]|nr:MAG: ATP-NAD kinase [Candidatus Lokiarchaeota archaeon]